jgi:hypothetical protein
VELSRGGCGSLVLVLENCDQLIEPKLAGKHFEKRPFRCGVLATGLIFIQRMSEVIELAMS